PSIAGTAASACIADMTVTPAAPTLSAAFSPASVAVNAASEFTLTLNNSNQFFLTQSAITISLPANLILAASPGLSTSCSGAAMSLSSTTGSVALTGADIPANGSCNIVFSVQSASEATYTNPFASNALMTGPAGGNAVAATATLTVTAAGSGGGGGSMDWLDIMLATGVLLVVRGHASRRPRHGACLSIPREPRWLCEGAE